MTSAWSSLLSRGADLAREAVERLERRKAEDDVAGGFEQAGYLAVLYVTAPRLCTSDDVMNLLYVKKQTTDAAVSVGDIRNAFLQVPLYSTSLQHVQVRFRLPTPSNARDLFPSYIWADLPDSAVPPVAHNGCIIARVSWAGPRIPSVPIHQKEMPQSVVSSPGPPRDRDPLQATAAETEPVGNRVKDAVEKQKERQAKEQRQVDEILQVSEETKLELQKWSHVDSGEPKDMRTLIGTMDQVLWDGAQWKPVNLSQMVVMNSNDLRRLYHSAILVTHPDKQQGQSADAKVRAQHIFRALNESFKKM